MTKKIKKHVKDNIWFYIAALLFAIIASYIHYRLGGHPLTMKKEVIWNTALKQLKDDNWTFAGRCNCPANISKYRKGKLIIKLGRTGMAARLMINNTTIKFDSIENIKTLIERAAQEA